GITWASWISGCVGETSMVTGCTQQGMSSPEKQMLMGMPSRLHGFALCWPVTMKASHFSDNCNLSALGVVAYPNFAPATIYAPGVLRWSHPRLASDRLASPTCHTPGPPPGCWSMARPHEQRRENEHGTRSRRQRLSQDEAQGLRKGIGAAAGGTLYAPGLEIGRATCRERVEIS